jgi:hypothetical protein
VSGAGPLWPAWDPDELDLEPDEGWRGDQRLGSEVERELARRRERERQAEEDEEC